MRDSHSDQFRWLENKIKIELTKDLDAWKNFIEVTERRNLFVHCNGIVSSQYINVCKAQRVKLDPDIKIGTDLGVTAEYFGQAYRCVFEIGVKLAHVLWRKLKPEQRKAADSNLTNITYDLIYNEEYDLANILLEFATKYLKPFSSEDARLTFVVNKAQSLRWGGNIEGCERIVKEIDWSACSDKFKLASSVLLGDFVSASRIMKKIGVNEDIDKTDYRNWPLFRDFRKSEEFLKIYEEIFGEQFCLIELPPKAITRLIQDAREVIHKFENQDIKADGQKELKAAGGDA